MDICITPQFLSGEITPPASKSELHRLLIAAALAEGPTTIFLPAGNSVGEQEVADSHGMAAAGRIESPGEVQLGVQNAMQDGEKPWRMRSQYAVLSADILATIDCLRELGATIDIEYEGVQGGTTPDGATQDGVARKASAENATCKTAESDTATYAASDVATHGVPNTTVYPSRITVQPIAETPRFVTLNAKDSASTLRFLMPVASVLCEHVAWVGSDQLAARPLDSALAILREHGVVITETNPTAMLPLITDGFFACDEVTVKGNVSSQYVSGMLFAMAAQARRDSMARQTTQAERNGIEQITQDATTQGDTGQAESAQDNAAQGVIESASAEPDTVAPAASVQDAIAPANPVQRIVRVDGTLVSAPYAVLTVDILRRFGLEISPIDKTTVDGEPRNSAHDCHALRQNTTQAEGQTSRQAMEQGAHNPLVANQDAAWCIQAGSHLTSPGCVLASCDWSNAAPFLALAAYYPDVKVRSLDSGSLQGDQACAQLIETLVADTRAADTHTTLESCTQESCTEEFYSEESRMEESSKDALSRNTRAGDMLAADAVSVKSACTETLCIDMQNMPDLFPVLACLAAAPRTNERITRFMHTARLRTKESDRVASTAALIHAFGGEMDVSENECIVHSTSCAADSFVSVARSTGGEMKQCSVPCYTSNGEMKQCSVPCYTGDPVTCSSAHDHRIVMAATLCAHIFNRRVIIEDAECVAKSYPAFFDDYRSLGGAAQ